MQIGFNTLYDIGSAYTIKINEKEMLIIEEDKLRSVKKSDSEKIASEVKTGQEKKDILKANGPEKLSEDEQRMVNNLASRDSEVRAHEAAHQAAGGGMTGAASFTYQQGPDGKMYAIGGEVSISMKSGSTPEETIANARQIAAAAMAAGNPSPQDFAVASSARVMEMKAQQQLARKEQEAVQGKEIYQNEANKNSFTIEKENASKDVIEAGISA
ncbi:MAG: hypothetical protein FP820_05920 [Sulfurimonas sp.]|nr:hypothetical protein [Sulfurimonas sp.]MBU1216870.1 hypothetical protein [bacterium]MBU1434997.1 hypothetical protein [bacterium]MBU1504102.1 hypothetical protein [bacterium]MBU3938547.1 hypothetical protein [bacterium]